MSEITRLNSPAIGRTGHHVKGPERAKVTLFRLECRHAASFGIVIGALLSVMEHLIFRFYAGWSSLEIMFFMIGRLSALAVLFALVARSRNVIAKSRHQRDAK